MLLVHYGHRKFDKKRFNKVKNDWWNKPFGGFWACPIETNEWKEWSMSERFRLKRLKSRMFLKLTSKRICKIDSLRDLKNKFDWLPVDQTLPEVLRTNKPDFEKMAQKYDAIFLTSKGQARTRLTHDYNLYGWDCECVLVLNPNKIKQLNKWQIKKNQLEKRLKPIAKS